MAGSALSYGFPYSTKKPGNNPGLHYKPLRNETRRRLRGSGNILYSTMEDNFLTEMWAGKVTDESAFDRRYDLFLALSISLLISLILYGFVVGIITISAH
jgi:hypothetical protein